MFIGFLYFARQNKRALALVPSLLSKGEIMLAETMRDLEDIIPSPSDFVQSGEGGETIIREDVALLIDAFGSRVSKSFRMNFLQGLGANAKIEKGLKSAITQDIIEEKMPIINLIGEFMGINTKQYIAKHPEAIAQLGQIAAPYLKEMNLQSQNNSNGGM